MPCESVLEKVALQLVPSNSPSASLIKSFLQGLSCLVKFYLFTFFSQTRGVSPWVS